MATFVGLPSFQHHTGSAVLTVASHAPQAPPLLRQDGLCTASLASAAAVSTVASLGRIGSRRRRAQGRVTRHFFFGGDETPKSSVGEGDSIYQFTVADIDGNSVPLSTYEGKVTLIVNVASK